MPTTNKPFLEFDKALKKAVDNLPQYLSEKLKALDKNEVIFHVNLEIFGGTVHNQCICFENVEGHEEEADKIIDKYINNLVSISDIIYLECYGDDTKLKITREGVEVRGLLF